MAHRVSPFDSERPNLPPLHTLNLPSITRGKFRLPGVNDFYESYEPQTPLCPSAPFRWGHPRQTSISSSTSSRTPSPTPSEVSSSHPKSVFIAGPRLRLVPTSLENADAVVLVAPPNAPHIPPLLSSPNSSPVSDPQRGQALLLVGPALQHLRHPQRKIAKGARIHPYRIVRNERKSSVESMDSA